MRLIYAYLIAALLLAQAGMAQTTPNKTAATSDSTPDVSGPTAFVQAEGTNFDMGAVTTYDFNVGYQVNQKLSLDIGVPIFGVRSPFAIVAGHDWRYTEILGAPYLDVRYDTKRNKTNITTILTGSMGLNEVKTFSTGRTEAQWFTHLDRQYQVLTYDAVVEPFLNFDAGTGTVDRQVFSRPYELARPYETLGYIGTGEVGAAITLRKFYKLEGSAYGLSPWGPQKVYSRLVSPDSLLGSDGHHNRYWDEFFSTDGDIVNTYGGGPSRIARDNGYGGYLTISKYKNLTVQMGYTRSVHYDYGAAFIMINYNFTKILRNLTVGD